ncbi:MAG: uracil-DNA glycosylase [Gammaproteobacteria bacterium]|nr:uracil-DNA glycosylase [Gammaproteobacteria bacterium]
MSTTLKRVRLEESWKQALESEFTASYMTRLRKFLLDEASAGKKIYPPFANLFTALDLCPVQSVRVVIIGQDPYHRPNQAHGLCFSVQPGVPPPPSLVNILKEVQQDLQNGNIQSRSIIETKGCLSGWAEQGVLLLNSVLTVIEGRPGAHQGYGWERFTDRVVDVVNQQCENVVFMLWGRPAQKKGELVDDNKHLILKAAHPSPLSAERGFIGCRHFSQANQYLTEHGHEPIDWFRVI